MRLRLLRLADSVGEALTDEHLGVVLGAAVAGQSEILVGDARLGGALHDGRDVVARVGGGGGVGLLLL